MKTRTKRMSRDSLAGQSAAPQCFRPDHLTAIRGLLTRHEDVREGRMFGYPAFFIGRRMFACVYGDGVGIKVPVELAVRLLERIGTEPFRPHGKSTMREWVQINHARSKDYQADLCVLLASIRFVAQGQKSERRT